MGFLKKRSKSITAVALAIMFTFLLLPLQPNMYASAAEPTAEPAVSQSPQYLEDYTKKYGWEPVEGIKPLTNIRKTRSLFPKPINYLAILIEFPDTDMQDIFLDNPQTLKAADMIMNTGGTNVVPGGKKVPVTSLKDYFTKFSYSSLNISTSFFPKNTSGNTVSYVSKKPRTYYMRKTATNPNGYEPRQQYQREEELLEEVLKAVKPDIEARFSGSDLDSNSDGYIDAMNFFVESKFMDRDISWGDLLWSHKAQRPMITTIGGKSVGSYNLNNAYDSKSAGGIFSHNSATNLADLTLFRADYGVVFHEFLHTFGLPDLYRGGSATGHPIGFYDIMAATNGGNPQGTLSIFNSDWLNWNGTIPEVSKSGAITIQRPKYTDRNERTSYKIYSPLNDKEYFIVEFYQKQDHTPLTGRADGLIIYRVNTNNRTNIGGLTDGLGDYLYIFRPGETSLGAAAGTLQDAVVLPTVNNTYGKTLDQTGTSWDKDTLYFSDGRNSGIKLDVTAATADQVTLNVTVPTTTGTGTQADPFLISSVDDWNSLIRDDKHAKLTKDIDFTGATVSPISSFTGTLDGNGKTISNVTINGGGLFNSVNGTIKDLTIDNIRVTGKENTHAGALADSVNGGTIQNVKVKSGSVTGGNSPTYASQGVGGLIGSFGSTATVNNCSSAATVSNGKNLGGLIGLVSGGTVQNSYANGSVVKSAGNKSGGLYGSAFATTHATFTNCAYDMRVTNHDTANNDGDRTGITGYSSPETITLDLNGVNESSLSVRTKPQLTSLSADSRFDSYAIAAFNMGTQKIYGISVGTTNMYVDIRVGTNTMPLATTINVKAAATGVKPSEAAVTLQEGSNKTLTASLLPADTTDTATYAWTSADAAVATVNNNTGEITGVKAGTTTITVTATLAGGRTFTADVAVTITSSPKPITGVTVTPATLELQRGTKSTLTATLTPADTTDNKAITWSSDNEAIATVNAATGEVTAVAPGKATITATTSNNMTATSVVTVKVAATGVKPSEDAVTLSEGNNQTLTATLLPADSTDTATYTWTSADNATATVSSTGEITGVKTGKTTVTVTAALPGSTTTFTATVDVTVTPRPKPITGVTVLPTTLELERGTTSTLTATLTPADTTEDKTITWTSSDTAIATVDAATGEVTAVAPGSATITATTSNNTIKATSAVTVKSKATGVKPSKDNVTLLVGNEETITASLLPADSTDTATYAWTSANGAIATVDNTGKITGVTAGTTTVTVTATLADGTTTFTASVNVTVSAVPKPITGVTVTPNTLEMERGSKSTLTATLTPADTTDSKTITWSSSDAKIATVDATTGEVTAVAPGKATITATTSNNTITATSAVTVKIAATGVKPSENTVALREGGRQTLTASLLPADSTDTATYTWSSADTAVATVTNTGEITGVKAGTTTVTVTATLADGTTTFTANVNVTVTVVPKPITGVTVAPNTLEMERGTKSTLTATLTPTDTTEDKTITWSSSDETIATVNAATGEVTAVAPGKATITATTSNNTITATSAVTVKIAATGVKPSKNNVALLVGNEETITASLLPAGTTDTATYTWTSADAAVATVDNAGKITGVKAGTTTVTVTATLADGTTTFTARVNVTVTAVSKPITGVTVAPTILEMEPGTKSTLTATLTPADTTDNKTITWSSSNATVATVDAATGEVTAVAPGSATITATTSNNAITATSAVTVKIKATGVKPSETAVTLQEGGNQTLTASLLPANTTDTATYTWSSADAAIATVNNAGRITAVKAGKTTVTVTATLPGGTTTFTANVPVTVTPIPKPITGVTVAPTTLEIERGKKSTLTATLTPADTTDNKTITWSSSDTKIAIVDAATGEVTAVAPGKATITATTSNNMTATSVVTVKVPATSITVNTNHVSLIKGQNQTVVANLLPLDTTSTAAFTWSSADDTIATVDKNGRITGIKAGTTQITVRAAITRAFAVNDPFTATITVTVSPTAFDRLQAKYDVAQSAINDGLFTGAPQSFIDALKAAMTNANALLALGEGNSQDADLNQAYTALDNALNNFTFINALNEMQNLVNKDLVPYDTTTTADFIAKKKEAEKVLLNPLNNLDKINTTLAELKAANDAMVLRNPSALQQEITISQDIDLTQYFDGTEKDKFKEQLKQAQTILASATTNAEYQAALDALTDAKQKLELVKKATEDQKAAIQAGITALKEMLENNQYTDADRTQIQNAIAAAQEALAYTSLTYVKAESALDMIAKAKALAPENNDNNNGNNNNNEPNNPNDSSSGNGSSSQGNGSKDPNVNGQNSQSSQDDKDLNSQTGDNTILWIVVAVSAVSLSGIAAIIIVKVRSKKERD